MIFHLTKAKNMSILKQSSGESVNPDNGFALFSVFLTNKYGCGSFPKKSPESFSKEREEK